MELLRSNSWCDTSTGVTSTPLEPSRTSSFAQGAFSRSVRRACAGCRSRYPAGPDGQPTSSRLGLGLTAPAPDHQPRGHLHPQDRRRIDFDHADKLLVLFFPHVSSSTSQQVLAPTRRCSHACQRAPIVAPLPPRCGRGLHHVSRFEIDRRRGGWWLRQDSVLTPWRM